MNESNDQLRLVNPHNECLDFFIQESDFIMLKEHLGIKEYRAEAILTIASLTLLMLRRKYKPNYDLFEHGLIETLLNYFMGSFQLKISDEEPKVFITNRIHENMNELIAFFNQHSLYEKNDLVAILEKNSNYYFVSSSILFHLYKEPLSNRQKFCFDKELNRHLFLWLINALPKVIKISNQCSLMLDELNTVSVDKHQDVRVSEQQNGSEIVINSMSEKRTVNSKIPLSPIEQVNLDYEKMAMITRQFIDKISFILFNPFKQLSPGYYRLFRACWLLFPLVVSFLLYAIISLFGHTGFYKNGIMYYEATDIALKWFFILLIAYYPIARISLWVWEGFQAEKK